MREPAASSNCGAIGLFSREFVLSGADRALFREYRKASWRLSELLHSVFRLEEGISEVLKQARITKIKIWSLSNEDGL